MDLLLKASEPVGSPSQLEDEPMTVVSSLVGQVLLMDGSVFRFPVPTTMPIQAHHRY